MRIDVVTLFPDFFTTPLRTGLVGHALEEGAVVVGFVDPRAFTRDRHRTVDDAPYGGGGGMVMKVEPLVEAIAHARANGQGRVVLMSPQGEPLRQAHLLHWSQASHLVLVAGRYEGFDERVRGFVDEEISLGDYVLTGGEYAALTVIDGVVRLLPGTLGNEESKERDSFSDGLLEHPQYTRPRDFSGLLVPDVLVSGDHQKVGLWRRREALRRTRQRRPDLLEEVWLSATDCESLVGLGPKFEVDLAMDLDVDRVEASVPQLVRLALSYGVRRVFVRPTQRGESGAIRETASSVRDEAKGTSPSRLASTVRARVRAIEPIVVEAPRVGSRVASRRPPPVARHQRPEDIIEVVEDWSLEGDCATLFIGVPTGLSPDACGTVLGPRALRSRLSVGGSRVCFCIVDQLQDFPRLGAVWPTIRAGSPEACLEAITLASIVLDRFIGEA